jgi:hypothetical protein
VTIEIVFELAFTDEGILDETFLTSRLDQCSPQRPDIKADEGRQTNLPKFRVHRMVHHSSIIPLQIANP